jgi:hypothetical protein
VLPGLPRALNKAWAPKLIRRAKGVVGTLRAAGPSTSSSMALSLTESSEPLVEMLPRRALPGKPNPEVWMGDAPESPIAAMDILRPAGVVAAAVTGLGLGWTGTAAGPATLLLRAKREEKVLPVKEERRSRLRGGELLPSDILSGYNLSARWMFRLVRVWVRNCRSLMLADEREFHNQDPAVLGKQCMCSARKTRSNIVFCRPKDLEGEAGRRPELRCQSVLKEIRCWISCSCSGALTGRAD